MRTSIFGKFSVIFTVIIILTSVFSCILMYNFVENYTVDSRREDIRAAIDDLEIMYIQYLVSYSNGVTESGEWSSVQAKEDCDDKLNRFKERMQFYFKQLDSHIYFSKDDGRLLFSYPYLPNINTLTNAEYLSKNIYLNLLKVNESGEDVYYFSKKQQFFTGAMENISVDSEGFSEIKGDFYGLYSSEDTPRFTVSKIVYFQYPDSLNSVEYGKITFCSSMVPVEKAKTTILNYFILITVITIIAELVVLLAITKKITKPITKVEKMTKDLAKGNYRGKIQNTSHDEIGVLIDSYNNLADALDSLDKMRSDFIAAVSHELRTPMTTIRGFVDAMLDGVIPPDRQQHYLTVIKEEIIRMNALVNDLLDMARLQSGAVQLDLQKYDIVSIIYNIVSKLEPIITEKDINIVYDIDCEKNIVITDKASIERVLINLIQNSVKFTPVGGTITLGLRQSEGLSYVSVADNGIGIKEDELQYIFERFYKADKSRGLDKKGTGLGLAITKSIIDAHGQTITVESKLGEGTKFTFTLQGKER